MCDTNKNVTKMGLIIKRVYCTTKETIDYLYLNIIKYLVSQD